MDPEKNIRNRRISAKTFGKNDLNNKKYINLSENKIINVEFY